MDDRTLHDYLASADFKRFLSGFEQQNTRLRKAFDVDGYEDKFRRVVGAVPGEAYFEAKLIGFLVGSKGRSLGEAEEIVTGILKNWNFPLILATLDRWHADIGEAGPRRAVTIPAGRPKAILTRANGPRKNVIAALMRIAGYTHKQFAAELKITEHQYRDWRRNQSSRNDEIIRADAASWLSGKSRFSR